MSLPEEVRAHAAAVLAGARHVHVDEDALARLAADPPPVPDPAPAAHLHLVEGDPEDVARAMLIQDTVNFGSGWFPTLRKRRDHDGRAVSGATSIAWSLTDHARTRGPWSNAQLRVLDTPTVAAVLGQPPDHELMSLYAQALRALGRFLGDRTVLDLVAGAGGSAAALARTLADGMPMFADHGFHKRAQITPSDLAMVGVGRWRDLDALTIFADNLVPHVLRCEGVLVYDAALAERIAEGVLLPLGGAEAEIRAGAVTACARLAALLGVSERALDGALWNRGQDPAYKALARHRCRCVFY